MRLLPFFCDSHQLLDTSTFVRDHPQRLNGVVIKTISACCHSLEMFDDYEFISKDSQ